MSKNFLSDEEKDLWKHVTQDIKIIKRDKAAPPPRRTIIRKRQYTELPSPPSVQEPVATLSPRDIKDIHIQARLDLHGYTIDQASLSLERFLSQCQYAGYKWVLVITGKGGQGILKDFVPRWLEQNNGWVVGYKTAMPQHGGDGALYVRVRRLR